MAAGGGSVRHDDAADRVLSAAERVSLANVVGLLSEVSRSSHIPADDHLRIDASNAETPYINDDDAYDDDREEEPVLEVVRIIEPWELEVCICRNSTPMYRLVPGESRLRCSECARPYRGLRLHVS